MQSFVEVKKVKNVSCYLNSLKLKLDRDGVNFRVIKTHLWAGWEESRVWEMWIQALLYNVPIAQGSHCNLM